MLKFIVVMIAINIVLSCSAKLDDGQLETSNHVADGVSMESSSSDAVDSDEFDGTDNSSSSYQVASSANLESSEGLSSSSINQSSADAEQTLSSSAIKYSSSSFVIDAFLPEYEAEDQVIWEIKAYIVNKFDFKTCYGMPEGESGMNNEIYNSSLDEISFIENYFSIIYERVAVSCLGDVDYCNYEYTKVDAIMRQFDEIKIVTDGEHIYAKFRDGQCSTIIYYQGEIIFTEGGFTDQIEVVKMDTHVPC